jgi:hypothetical protein
MARIRTVKPEFWTSEQVMECSPIARLAFIGMWSFCDDAGIHPASAKTLKAEVFPGDDITATEIEALVGELLATDLLVEYEAAGKRYWHVTGWHHQRIDQPTYKHPRPDGTIPEGAARRRADQQKAPRSSSVRAEFAEQSQGNLRVLDGCSSPEGKGKEGSGQDRKSPPFIPPVGGDASPPRKQRSERGQTFTEWRELIKAKGEKQIAGYQPMVDYAEKTGLPLDFISLAWDVFRRRFIEDEKAKKKKYINWRATFLNYIKGNYLKLWAWSDRDNCYVLTTVGQQADREHREAA